MAKIPNLLSDFLNPDIIKENSSIKRPPPTLKRNDVMTTMIKELNLFMKSNGKEFKFEKFTAILPVLPSVNSNELLTQSDDSRIKSLAVSPIVIVDKIWAHLMSFLKFSEIDALSIPEHIYQNLLEPIESLRTVDIDYSVSFEDLSTWLNSLKKWYYNNNDLDGYGWNTLFSLKLQDVGERVTFMQNVFDLLVVLVSLYFYAIRVYLTEGNEDLRNYWTMSLQERQGEMLEIEPSSIPERFVYKYTSRQILPAPVSLSHIPSPPHKPPPPTDPYEASVLKFGNKRYAMMEIYYVHMLSTHIDEFKRITGMRCLYFRLGRESNYNERFNKWLINSLSLVDIIKKLIVFKDESEAFILNNKLVDLLKLFE